MHSHLDARSLRWRHPAPQQVGREGCPPFHRSVRFRRQAPNSLGGSSSRSPARPGTCGVALLPQQQRPTHHRANEPLPSLLSPLVVPSVPSLFTNGYIPSPSRMRRALPETTAALPVPRTPTRTTTTNPREAAVRTQKSQQGGERTRLGGEERRGEERERERERERRVCAPEAVAAVAVGFNDLGVYASRPQAVC